MSAFFGMIIAVVKMKIVVVSDSHGRDDALEYVLQQHGDAYAYIHCGDIDADPGAFPRFVTVGGNNDIVCYGHTHIAADETVDGIRLINPGSLWRSRDGRGPSYALLNIDGDTVDVQFEFLPQKQKKSKFFW